ncbi:hypothetical protein NDN08_001279 [Rhodosorus marinus]|uniref:COP9 signalosome complex subunit 5 n=1 Tax=Rhodosorus marinus TaxID=101924 RepID=A0AAV8UUI9_9RHOD|nr:hypothetical protein NDN08_001279 [Rhodosorus marinus]
MDAKRALQNWETANKVDTSHEWFEYDNEALEAMRRKQPWKKDPNYFKYVHVSALALIKMVMHAKSGGRFEVMGSLMGKFEPHSFIVMDSFPLPVEGTEVRVEALDNGEEFRVNYQCSGQEVNRKENSIGWYHSHPDYGCWLSGIDVNTQRQHQDYSDPWVAIVVDPIRTMSSGKVDIGAFRTYKKDYQPRQEMLSSHQVIPLEKIAEYGHHHSKYYKLEIKCFKSKLDASLLEAVWNRFWASTLSTSPLLEDRAQLARQITDLSKRMKHIERDRRDATIGYLLPNSSSNEADMMQVMAEAQKVSNEQIRGLLSLTIKNQLFNG